MFRTSYNNLDVPQLAVTDVLHDTLGSVKNTGLMLCCIRMLAEITLLLREVLRQINQSLHILAGAEHADGR